MLPAAGQGIVAVECAASDWRTRSYLALIDDPAARRCCDAEREVLWVLNGHCNSPIAAYSSVDGTRMTLTASVLDEAGGQFIEAACSGPADRPRELGRAIGLELLNKGAAAIIARTRPGP
jgi:hydroxymethylbilane synthase